MDTSIPPKTLINLLPDSCREMLEIGVSLEAVLALVRHCGGSHICVPYRVRESSKLARAIGLALAREVSKACGGMTVVIPRCKRLNDYLRDVAVLKDYADGKLIADISKAHGVTDRCIGLIIARHGKQNRSCIRKKSARNRR